MKKEVVVFRKDVSGGETIILDERIKSNGRIVEVRVRFYDGSEGSFHVRPYVLHKGSLQENVVSYPDQGEQFISGNDDYFNFPVSVDVENDDQLKVWAENTSTFLYTLVVDVVLVYDQE